ncbi:MAG: hypothetical protein ABIR47_09740 [Candidatus Kapaibacterium sp.]
MRYSLQSLFASVAIVSLALALGGCPSHKRITLEGYNEGMLAGKRVAVIVPASADLVLADPAAYASSRGIDGGEAAAHLATEFPVNMTHTLGEQFDSNTVVSYKDQPVAGIVNLNATSSFAGGMPKSWDDVKRAGREGLMDYMIVLNNVTMRNSTSSAARGKEGVDADYILIDSQRGKVMTSGHISLSQEDVQTPMSTYQRLANQLAEKLPFSISVAAKK